VISDVLAEAKIKMDKAVEIAKEDFATVRTGRANPALFQKILVEYYGTPTPLGQLASMQNPEARTLLVTPYDKGAIIRVTLPELTEERRKEFVKIVRSKGEEAKVAVRNIRRTGKDALDALKSEVGEDELARAEKELDAVTKAHVDAIDEALRRKEIELLEV
jgi:ribosome recycling factor